MSLPHAHSTTGSWCYPDWWSPSLPACRSHPADTLDRGRLQIAAKRHDLGARTLQVELGRRVVPLHDLDRPDRGQKLLLVLQVVDEVDPEDLALLLLLRAEVAAHIHQRILRTSFLSMVSDCLSALIAIGVKSVSGSS